MWRVRLPLVSFSAFHAKVFAQAQLGLKKKGGRSILGNSWKSRPRLSNMNGRKWHSARISEPRAKFYAKQANKHKNTAQTSRLK